LEALAQSGQEANKKNDEILGVKNLSLSQNPLAIGLYTPVVFGSQNSLGYLSL
jgi:hypothetical protein